MARARVHIRLKEGILDPQGKATLGALKSLGYEEVKDVRVGKYIEMELENGSKKQLESRVNEMCERLLANPIIEDYWLEVED
ncbi:MAG: phosphoribosylformylglycinamidine synthase subunit PurS [Actinomycetota bacterium]|nr:phosphoribosylformylglycinamidine synthase subunit PurS [Actinomycetota bacterium]